MGFDNDFRRAQRGVFAAFGLVALFVVAFWTTVVVVALLVLSHYGII